MQTTMPIKDHAEMGYSGQNAPVWMPGKLGALPYYRNCFSLFMAIPM
jgi:hypothetical protein